MDEKDMVMADFNYIKYAIRENLQGVITNLQREIKEHYITKWYSLELIKLEDSEYGDFIVIAYGEGVSKE